MVNSQELSKTCCFWANKIFYWLRAENPKPKKAHPTALARGEIMKRSAALFPIALALGAITLAPWASAQAQDSRQEGPIEIEKCQTINQAGSYKLVNNLTFTGPSNGLCLSITANFVTIDFAGFTISSSSAGSESNFTVAIAAGNDTTGITVRNGSISGFGSGVALDGSNSIVEGLHVGGPCPCQGTGISATGIVRGNTVSVFTDPNTGPPGISATGIVSGNYVFNTRNFGIVVGQGSTVIGNTVTDTFGVDMGIGLEVTCPSNVTNNTVVNSEGQKNLVLVGNGCNNTNNVAP
jgi:hypothetical protein